MSKRIVLAMTGASGSILGLRLLEALKTYEDVESHLVVSRAAALTIRAELECSVRDLELLADVVHSDRNVGAAIASGSFQADAMIIAPCSMNTLGCIAAGISSTLVCRAADVAFKERRRVVLLVRETPLNLVHLRNMATVAEMGGVIFPPVPAFYARLESIDDLVDQTVARVLDLVGLEPRRLRRWLGIGDVRQDD